MTAPTRPITMDEFLALPEEKPYREYLRGDVSEKSMPNRGHARLVRELLTDLTNYLRRTGEGEAYTELRHAARTDDWVYLPDINVTLRGRMPARAAGQARGPEEVTPDFSIEVLSPDDRAVKLLERVDLYMRAGTRLLWVVNPENETITAYRPGEVTIVHRAGSTIDAKLVLEGFSLDVAALFDAVRDS